MYTQEQASYGRHSNETQKKERGAEADPEAVQVKEKTAEAENLYKRW